MYSPRLFLKDRFVALACLVLYGVALSSVWYTATKIGGQNGQFFLHSNIIFGVDWVGDRWQIWFISGALCFMALANSLIAWMFYASNRSLSKCLLAGGALVAIVGAYALNLVIGLNV